MASARMTSINLKSFSGCVVNHKRNHNATQNERNNFFFHLLLFLMGILQYFFFQLFSNFKMKKIEIHFWVYSSKGKSERLMCGCFLFYSISARNQTTMAFVGAFGQVNDILFFWFLILRFYIKLNFIVFHFHLQLNHGWIHYEWPPSQNSNTFFF